MGFRWTGNGPARQGTRVSLLLAILAFWLGGTAGFAATVERVEIGANGVAVTADDRLALGAGTATATLDLAGGGLGIRGAGNRLRVALATADDATFARAAAEGSLAALPPVNFGLVANATKYRVTVPVPAGTGGGKLPRIYGDDPTRPLVVIDAGHGGFDPGAVSPTSGLREKDVTLRIALAIRDELLKSGRVRVALTREDDRFIVLRDRFGLARRLKADLFISIHCDSVGQGDASGASIYTLSEIASDKEAARLAARENKADVIAGIDLGSEAPDVSSILIDLARRETMNSSASFARLLGREARPLIALRPDFHRMASLMVLKAPDMPSILFETGYISNETDASFLASGDGRRRIADAIERAVGVFFAKRLASKG